MIRVKVRTILEVAKDSIGGAGFGIKYLFDEVPAGAGAVGMALTGGHFPVELKFAGYDALIVEGKAEKPTYVWIKDGEVKFRGAKKLWGMKTTDTQQIIKNDLKDQNIRVACIGPAGENQIKIASIINEWRAVGRKGLGADMNELIRMQL